MRTQEEQRELQKKVHRRICVRDISFLTARPPIYVIFRLLPPFCLLQFYVEKIFLIQKMEEAAPPPCPTVSTALTYILTFVSKLSCLFHSSPFYPQKPHEPVQVPTISYFYRSERNLHQRSVVTSFNNTRNTRSYLSTR